MSKEILKAVHDDDLNSVLIALGLIGDFNHGKLKCAFCKDSITFDNLHSIIPHSGAVKVSCTKKECVESLLLILEEGKA